MIKQLGGCTNIARWINETVLIALR